MLTNASDNTVEVKGRSTAARFQAVDSAAQDLFSIPPLIARGVRRKLTGLPSADLPPVSRRSTCIF
jgi:hypothetical protein